MDVFLCVVVMLYVFASEANLVVGDMPRVLAEVWQIIFFHIMKLLKKIRKNPPRNASKGASVTGWKDDSDKAYSLQYIDCKRKIAIWVSSLGLLASPSVSVGKVTYISSS